MKAFLIDANVVSELWKPDPSPAVLAWFAQDDLSWFLPVPVIAEIQEGAEAAPRESRKAEINRKLDEFLRQYSALVKDWDAEAARQWARLRHSPEVKRKPQALWDSLIDAMGVRYNQIIATRNRGDFRHAETFDPWEFRR